jgi:hypothetical protein
MERLPRNVGKNGKAPEKATTIYYCPEHGCVIEVICDEAVAIGWLDDKQGK